jgi:hypothetical protein
MAGSVNSRHSCRRVDSLHDGGRPNLNEAAIERGTSSHIREPFRGKLIDPETSDGVFVPADAARAYSARFSAFRDVSVQEAPAAIIVDLNQHALGDISVPRIHRMNCQERHLAIGLQTVSEGRVHAVIVLARDEFERVFCSERRIPQTRFARRRVT